jgi:adenine-specific DNA-methyltransferase
LKKNKKLSFSTGEGGLTHSLIVGDNYDALLNLLITHRGKIDVIYIDPPYASNGMGEFAKTNYENALSRDNLLSQLYPRLLLAKDLMADAGVIFCSIDDKNQAYVKCLFDEVFGERNFVSTIIWRKKTGASDARGLATITEYILCYIKNASYVEDTFSKNENSYNIKRYKYKDEHFDVRGAYYFDTLDRGGLQYSDSMNYAIEAPDGTPLYPNGRTEYKNDGWIWKWGRDKVQWGLDNDFIEIQRSSSKANGWTVRYKVYAKVDNEGNPIVKAAAYKNVFIDDVLNTDATNMLKEIFGVSPFKYAKPTSLLSQLFRLVNNPNAIILDFYAGSGTTGQAVLDLNKEDGGNRTFILATNNEKGEKHKNGIAYDITAERLRRVMTGTASDGNSSFEWAKKNEPYGDNFGVYDIASIDCHPMNGQPTPFDVIDETCYGLEKFDDANDKIAWVCRNFQGTMREISGEEAVNA